jgi:DNA-binding transcriptional ArsR family regulator
MGATKSDLFSTDQNELAELAKALAHPARIAILHLLSAKDQCINGTIVDEIGLAQATISQHLKALKEIGLVKRSIEGVFVSYCIDREKVLSLKNHFESLFEGLQKSPKSSECC